jgi:transcriptional regulator with XRE-family HTH domain
LSRSPSGARRRLGMELRDLREAAELRIEDAAKRLECSTAKISRLETGKGVPYARDIRDLVDLYGVGAQKLGELLELVEDGRAQDWYSGFRDVYPGADHLHRYHELERDADVISMFQSELIPGLLQTPGYADAICSTIYPEKSERERDRFVKLRIERQQVLKRRRPPELNVIMHESAIITRVGGLAWREVMRGQLEHLVTQLNGELKDVADLRLVPLSAEAPGALGGPFVILKYDDPDYQDLVYLEGREGATWLESDADVGRYGQLFNGLERDALSREASLDRLNEVAARLAQEEERPG